MSAIETADTEQRILSAQDRKFASRSATELANWAASERRRDSATELFLEKRAELVIRTVGERSKPFASLAARRGAWGWLGLGLPPLALLLGLAADHIGDAHRVDLLSPPLLIIIAWNLVVYAGLLLAPLLPLLRRAKTPALPDGWIARLALGGLKPVRKLPQPLALALARFAQEWIPLSRGLTAARIKRILHVSSACFALGAIASLYARGVFRQYRAGWESTFLDAQQVWTLLDLLFSPAIALFRLEGFTLAEVQALQAGGMAAAGSGVKWVHLYAATLLLAAVLPRLLLAAWARWRELRLARRFPLDLSLPAYAKLSRNLGGTTPAVLRIYPYSYTLDEVRQRNLGPVADMLLGEGTRVLLRPSIGYGEALEDAGIGQQPPATEPGMTVVLFNISATPEQENHGAFLARLGAAGGPPLAVLLDESAYAQRLGGQAGNEARLQERISLWQQFCQLHQARPVLVNLLEPGAHRESIEAAFGSMGTAA